MNDSTPTPYVPLLRFKSLDAFYDAALFISGLGKKFKKNIIRLSEIPRTTTSIVDVGCGTGTLMKLLHDFFPRAHIYGVDPDTETISNVKKKFQHLQNISLYNVGVEKLPFEDNTLDVCFSTLTFHHLTREKKQKAFKEIHRVLKPHGTLVLTDWGVLRFPALRYLLVFEEQDLLEDNVHGKIPVYAREHGFELKKEQRVKPSGIWLWKFQKISPDVL